jgi:hypothetical protein
MKRTGLLVSILGFALAWGAPASASTTQPFHAEFKETFGRAVPKPCEHFQCGTGTVDGYGKATSVLDITDFQPIEGTNCADFTAVRVITLVADGSTLTLDEEGVVCFPGNSAFAPGADVSFGNPARFEASFEITDGSGVFAGATGTGTDHHRDSGDQGHSVLDGTITLP